jgi:SAM-dependent methyltransferase
VTSDSFQRYSAYYDLLYHDKDYRGEADYVFATLRAANPTTKEVLEFGSGTGRHGCLLGERGLRVFGIERSESMVTAARNAARLNCHSPVGAFQCIRGDIRNIKIDHLFDAVLSLFHVISYQTTKADVVKTFANAAHHLKPRGVFLFDVWHGPAVVSQRPTVRIKRVEDDKTRIIRIAEPELDMSAGIVTVQYTILVESKSDGQVVSFCEEHRMRYFFPPEIELIAEQNGFAVEKTEEFLTGGNPSEKTWGVMYLLRNR